MFREILESNAECTGRVVNKKPSVVSRGTLSFRDAFCLLETLSKVEELPSPCEGEGVIGLEKLVDGKQKNHGYDQIENTLESEVGQRCLGIALLGF